MAFASPNSRWVSHNFAARRLIWRAFLLFRLLCDVAVLHPTPACSRLAVFQGDNVSALKFDRQRLLKLAAAAAVAVQNAAATVLCNKQIREVHTLPSDFFERRWRASDQAFYSSFRMRRKVCACGGDYLGTFSLSFQLLVIFLALDFVVLWAFTSWRFFRPSLRNFAKTLHIKLTLCQSSW